MKKFDYIFAFLSLGFVAFCFSLGWSDIHQHKEVIHDTITIVDTFIAPKPARELIIRRDTVPSADLNDTSEITIIHDTIDNTLKADVPILQRVYEDSTYRAVVSGYHVSLDTMEVKHMLIKEYVKSKKNWFSVGVGAGYDIINHRPCLMIGGNVNLINF